MYRVSLGLVGLLLSVLLAARNLDLLPDPDAAPLARRQAACEGVAVECALAAQRKDGPAGAAGFARAVARRHPDVLSVGVRDGAGALVVDTGEHESHWAGADPDKSTPTHMRVLVPRDDGAPFARVEVAFRPLPFAGWWRVVGGPLFPLVTFAAVGWFVVITLYLRAVFRRVDLAQTRVVPDRVRATLDVLAEGVLVLDKEGVIVLANEAFAKAVGRPPAELRGLKVSDLPWSAGTVDLRPDDHPWVRVVREASPQVGRVLGLRTATDDKTVSVNAAPIFAEDGTCRGALATFDDLTQVERAKAAAEAASRAKGEFLANVSHEIRTPMNAVIGMTELVLEGRLSPDQRECLGIVGESAASLLGVINDLLDLSKIEAGRLDLDPVEFDPRAVLDDTLQGLALRARMKGLELVGDVPPGVPEALVGDPLRVRQVLTNLVGNAIKFTAAGEVVARVRLEDSTAKRVRLHVTVSDTGIGIPADKLRAIFEPFTQADGSTTRKYGGTGLGLTISAKLVGMMGGSIWAESEVGAGSTFHFTAEFGVPTYSEVSLSVPDLFLPTVLRALVVDANASARAALGNLLAGMGLEPACVPAAGPALDALARAGEAGHPFALVLADASHPGADGFVLAEKLRDWPGVAGTMVLMLSVAARPQDYERCRRVGARHVRKPVRKADLLRTLQEITAPGPADRPPPRPGPDEGALDSLLAAVGPPLRILVVEDNPFNQKVAAMKLGRWGHRVRVAGSVREALAAVDAERFDLVLTDIQMPDADGFALVAAVRARDGEGRRLPVVAMTAHAMKGDRERFLAAGMDGYVAKPIRDEELLAAIRAAVPGHDGANDTAATGPQDTAELGAPPERFDEAAVMSRVGGNRETFRGLIEVFYQDCDKLMAEIESALRAGDGQRVRAAAHTIKGMVGFFGAAGATDAARQLEQAGEGGGLAGGAHLFATLGRELSALSDALSPYTPNVPPPGWHVGRGDRASSAEIVLPVEA